MLRQLIYLVSISLLCRLGCCKDLPVPWASQFYSPPSLIIGSHDCGPTSVLMVMAYFNMSGAPTPSDIENVSRWLQTQYPKTYLYNNGAGSDTGKLQLATIAKEFRISSQYSYLSEVTATNWTSQTALQNANQELILGHPLIVGVQTYMGTHDAKPRHFMVLRGLDLVKKLAYFNDPGRSEENRADAEDKSYSIDVFMKSWASQSYAVVVFHATPPSAATAAEVTQATFNGQPWAGMVNYLIAGANGTIIGQAVPGSTDNLSPGLYTMTYSSGGPSNSTLSGILPCGVLTRGPAPCSGTLSAGQTLTFTLQFTSSAPPTAGFIVSNANQMATNGQTLNIPVATGSTATVQLNGAPPYSFEHNGSITEWDWAITGSETETITGAASSFQRSWGAGAYTISLSVKDALGNVSQPVQVTVTIKAVAPIQTTGSTNEPRIFHTATLLNSGLVLIAGGQNATGISMTAELYDPAIGTWRNTRKPELGGGPLVMTTSRVSQSATLLKDGTVLISGGTNSSGPLQSAEIFDPTTETFTATTSMMYFHSNPFAVRLPDADGSVLVLNGPGGAIPELYNPISKKWTQEAAIPSGFTGLTAAALSDGRVWVGESNPEDAIDMVYIFSPLTNSWSGPDVPLLYGRIQPSVVQLNTGTLLIAAGYIFIPQVTDYSVLPTELYNVNTKPNGKDTAGPSLAEANLQNFVISPPGGSQLSSVTLSDGRVLLAGGAYSGDINAAPEAVEGISIYDPIANTLTGFYPMMSPRYGHTATLLPSGQVVIVGGNTANIYDTELTSSSELITVQ